MLLLPLNEFLHTFYSWLGWRVEGQKSFCSEINPQSSNFMKPKKKMILYKLNQSPKSSAVILPPM